MFNARSEERPDSHWNSQAYQHPFQSNQLAYRDDEDDPYTVPASPHEINEPQRPKKIQWPPGPKPHRPNQRQRRLAKDVKLPKLNGGRSAKNKAAVQTRSVACWTFQHGTDSPVWFFSERKWAKQRKIFRGRPDDKMPALFRGRTITAMDRLAQGACLEPPEDSVYCKVCGVLVIVPETHGASRFHQSRLRPQFSKEPLDPLIEDMMLNPGVLDEDNNGSEDGYSS